MTEETSPAIRNVTYSFVDAGVWLQVQPAIGPSVTVFVPNRMLAGLARVLTRRVTMLADGGQRDGEMD